jgi:integrase
MALFAVNTGCRDREICRLHWLWEVKVPIAEIGSVFIIPIDRVKNGEERSRICFTYKGKPITRMLNNGWTKARKLANLTVRVHDLKHTLARRYSSG